MYLHIFVIYVLLTVCLYFAFLLAAYKRLNLPFIWPQHQSWFYCFYYHWLICDYFTL